MTSSAPTASRRFIRVGLLCVTLAVAAYGTLQTTLDPKPAAIHVRWAPGVTDSIRTASEQRYRLSHGEPLPGRTWAYTLIDTSQANIAALIGDPVVEDTADIERKTFRVTRASTRGPYPPAPRAWISAGLRTGTVLCLLIGLIGITVGCVERVAPGTIAAWAVHRPSHIVALQPRQRIVLLLLMGVLCALHVTSMRYVGLTVDEPDHFLYGQNILKLESTRFDDSKMPISALNALPGALAARLPSGSLTSFLGRVETGRYVTVLFSLLVALGVFAWTRDLYGPTAGLLALTFYAFDPNILAHSQLITTDVYAAGTMMFALYSFWKFLHLGGWKRAVGSALMLGVAQIAKYTSIALFPLLVVITVGFHARELCVEIRERRFDNLYRRAVVFSGVAFAWVLIALLVINVGFLFNQTLTPLDQYPFQSTPFRQAQSSAAILGQLPLPVPYPYLQGLDLVVEHERTGSSYGRIYLLGELRQGEGFPGYYFYASLYKLPLATQAMLLAAAAAYLARRRLFDFSRNEAVVFWPTVFFAIYFNFFYRAQIGIRYFLVVFPLLYVFAGSLLATGIALTRAMRATVSVAIAGLIVSVLSYYPHFIPYFNELVWDRTQAYKVLADSNLDWGQNGRDVAQYEATHPGVIVEPDAPTAGTILVAVNALTGVSGDPEKFRWLREYFMPVDHVAHGALVYKISETDLRRMGKALAARRPLLHQMPPGVMSKSTSRK
jgi:ABC-type multidrug transport system fused ATPase/permease subunit